MSEQIISKKAHKVERMFASIAHRYDLVNSVLSFGMHRLWRRKLFSLIDSEEKTKPILDLCTGTADLALGFESRGFERVVGLDFCLPMLEIGQRKGEDRSYPVALVQGDALRLPFKDSSFAIVTVAFGVRNFENAFNGLQEILRVLQPGGKVYILEFGQPDMPVWSGFYRFYSRQILPLVGGLISGNREAYTYLPETSAEFECGEEFLTLLDVAGFQASEFLSLSGGIAYIYRAMRGFE